MQPLVELGIRGIEFSGHMRPVFPSNRRLERVGMGAAVDWRRRYYLLVEIPRKFPGSTFIGTLQKLFGGLSPVRSSGALIPSEESVLFYP